MLSLWRVGKTGPHCFNSGECCTKRAARAALQLGWVTAKRNQESRALADRVFQSSAVYFEFQLSEMPTGSWD